MRSVLFFVLALHFLSAVSQTENIWYGANEQVPKYEWQAQWIWMNDSINSDVMLARKTFELSNLPNEALLRITASSQYQLYINGAYVRRGPARSAPHHQSFDILNIAKLLRVGGNSIAVRVHQQRKKFSYHYKARGGLLIQLDMSSNGKKHSISTNSDWKVSSDLSWDNSAPLISRFQQIVSDRVDMRNYQREWKVFDYEDANWPKANVLKRNMGWPSVQKNDRPNESATPWTTLVPREVPYVNEIKARADNLIQAVQIDTREFSSSIGLSAKVDKSIAKGMKKYGAKKAALEIPIAEEGRAWFLLFDLGEVLNGTPTLEIQGTSGTEIEVVGAPFIVNDKFTYTIVDSEYRDRIILSGEKEFWEATYFKPMRYLGIVIHNSKAPIKLFSVGTHQLKYPFEEKGVIQSREAPWVKQYMDATAKTIDVCTTDAFTDNYRERRQYAQTGYYAGLGNYYLFGDTALQRRYLIQTAQEQQANGIMPAYAPAASDDYMVILDSNCLWIRSLYNYLLYSGDFKTVKELLPSAKKLMQLLNSFTNDLGMLDNPPYAYWLDHALIDRRGANFNLNGHYLGALEDFGELLEWLDDLESGTYKSRGTALRESLQSHFWNEEKQLFADALIDGEQSQMFSEHSNGTALALNIATPEQAKIIAEQLLVKDNHDYVRRKSGLIMATPAMSYYLQKGLCEYGYIDESFEMLRSRFDKMLTSNTNGTLWEEWRLDGIGRSGKLEMGRTRSDAQTESAFAPALFAEYLLGVKPIKPGMEEVEVYRTKSSINKMEAIVPSPHGNLFIKWDEDSNGIKSLKLEVPKEMIVSLNLESLKDAEGNRITVNGEYVSNKKQKNKFVLLDKGIHNILF